MPSVLIVDDSLLVRQGLKQILSQEHRGLIFGEARTAADAELRLTRRSWDVVIVEIVLPDKDGLYVVQEVRRLHPATRVLVLTFLTDPQHAVRAREVGANGFVCANVGRAGLLAAFQRVLAGEEYFEGVSAELPETAVETMPRYGALSTREYAVMLAIAAGKRTGDIAVELNLSVKTISTYKRRILDKLDLQSTADLVRYVIDQRLS